MPPIDAWALANTVTGFATLFAGLWCLGLTRWMGPQPGHWHFAYWMIVVTGVFTVTLHGFGEAVSGFGPRWIWGFLDTGSNIVVAWAVGLGALADGRRADDPGDGARARTILTAAMFAGLVWHFVDQWPATERFYLIPLGSWGGFYPGESCLIALSITTVVLFWRQRARIPAVAMPLLRWVVVTFLVGLALATASNDRVLYPFFSLHAIWHLVSAFGFVSLWAFNHRRFEALRQEAAASTR